MANAATDRFVPLAVIRHAHGVRGEVKIAPLTGTDIFSLPLHTEAGTPFRLTRTGIQKDLFLCRIEGIGDRNAAEALKGTQLGALRSQLPAEDDATYANDLIGLRVVNDAGDVLGTVRAIVNYGASDIVVMDTADGELMLPYSRPFFPSDPEGDTLLCLVPALVSGEEP